MSSVLLCVESFTGGIYKSAIKPRSVGLRIQNNEAIFFLKSFDFKVYLFYKRQAIILYMLLHN